MHAVLLEGLLRGGPWNVAKHKILLEFANKAAPHAPFLFARLFGLAPGGFGAHLCRGGLLLLLWRRRQRGTAAKAVRECTAHTTLSQPQQSVLAHSHRQQNARVARC